MPLFAKPGTFILQLDNLIQPGLDGIYSSVSVLLTFGLEFILYHQALLHATFYASSSKNPTAKTANMIIPISTFANNTGNDASVPPGFSVFNTLRFWTS